MDNAAFHKGGKIKQLIENAGCKLRYLTAYSPDLNPIEKYWAKIKHRMRQYIPHVDIYLAAYYAFVLN